MRFAFLLASTLSLAAAVQHPEVAKAYFSGRSADIVFEPRDFTRNDIFSIFVGSEIAGGNAVSPVDATAIGNVLTSSMGVQPLNAERLPSFVAPSLAARAKASLLLSIDAVGRSTLASMPATEALARGANAVQTPVKFPLFPVDSTSISASIAAGSTPSIHGIVSKSWLGPNGVERHAYMENSAEFSAVTANLADVTAQTFGGESVVVSVSGSRALAGAHCVNPAVQHALPNANFLCASFDGNAFTPFAAGPDVKGVVASQSVAQYMAAATTAEASLLSSLQMGAVRVSMQDEQTVAVSFRASTQDEAETTVTFDLRNAADSALFAEFMYIDSVIGSLTTTLAAKAADASPDHFAFTLAGVSRIADAYGADSEQYAAAVLVVDAVVPAVVAKLSAAYNNELVTAVTLLGSAPASRRDLAPSSVMTAVATVLPQLSGEEAARFLPSALYVPAAEHGRLASICHQLTAIIQQSNEADLPEVVCAGLRASRRPLSVENGRHLLQTAGIAADPAQIEPDSLEAVTDEQVQVYQIALWVTIALAFTLIFASYAIGCMNFKRDTLLYGTFNVAWEQGGRR